MKTIFLSLVLLFGTLAFATTYEGPMAAPKVGSEAATTAVGNSPDSCCTKNAPSSSLLGEPSWSATYQDSTGNEALPGLGGPQTK